MRRPVAINQWAARPRRTGKAAGPRLSPSAGRIFGLESLAHPRRQTASLLAYPSRRLRHAFRHRLFPSASTARASRHTYTHTARFRPAPAHQAQRRTLMPGPGPRAGCSLPAGPRPLQLTTSTAAQLTGCRQLATAADPTGWTTTPAGGRCRHPHPRAGRPLPRHRPPGQPSRAGSPSRAGTTTTGRGAVVKSAAQPASAAAFGRASDNGAGEWALLIRFYPSQRAPSGLLLSSSCSQFETSVTSLVTVAVRRDVQHATTATI